jgi:hypothetical protein
MSGKTHMAPRVGERWGALKKAIFQTTLSHGLNMMDVFVPLYRFRSGKPTGPLMLCATALRHPAVRCTLLFMQQLRRRKRPVSLACPDPHSRFFRWAARQAVLKAGGTGLRQFKSTFAPDWEPRYAAAPSPLALVIGLADITREVHQPNAIYKTKPQEFHNFDEYYELVSKQAS